MLAVLNKADLIATTAAARHPDGPTAAARVRCAQLSERAGIPVHEYARGTWGPAQADRLLPDGETWHDPR